ncbi:MAG: hypothetical protein R2941_24200 [Desulfobacterales bacterium]
MLTIELNLRRHCIETAVKRLHNRLLSEYFRSKGSDSESEEKLELLQKALNRFDFASLRTVHKELAGNSEARIVLTDNPGSPPEITPGITIDDRPIDMEAHIIPNRC